MATTTPSQGGTAPREGDAEFEIDLRRALAGLALVVVGLVVAELASQGIRAAADRFGTRHPLLAEIARIRP